MKVIYDMFEKHSTNNKLFLTHIIYNFHESFCRIKIFFQSKMEESGLVAAHVNDFNMIFNHLSSIEIEFDEEV